MPTPAPDRLLDLDLSQETPRLYVSTESLEHVLSNLVEGVTSVTLTGTGLEQLRSLILEVLEYRRGN